MGHPFSAEYIRMAPKALELQAQAPEQISAAEGDYFYCEMHEQAWIYPNFPDGEDRHSNDRWLPRLDQLLAMLGSPGAFIAACEGWEVTAEDWHAFTLELVMRERFQKKWDAKEGRWVTV